jgi:16S rRNA processing protein RimM
MAAGESESGYVRVGRVTKPHGIRGEVKIFPYSGEPANFRLFSHLILIDPESSQRVKRRILKSRVQGNLAVLLLEGVTGRNESENIAGFEVWAREDDLPLLAENEFYWHEMVGKKVVCSDGRELGVITSLMAGGGHDILIVSGKGHEYMIPARQEFLISQDEESGTVVVDLPPGLLEMNS